RLNAGDGRRASRALASVEGGDFAEYIARGGVVEGQLTSVAGEHGEADAPGDHEIDLPTRVAAGEDHLVGGEFNPAHARGDERAIGLAERPEQGRAAEQCDNRTLVHGGCPRAPGRLGRSTAASWRPRTPGVEGQGGLTSSSTPRSSTPRRREPPR